MGLFNRNNNRNNNIKVVNVENIQAMKESILAGNYVEIQFPTITSITDNIIKASKSGSFFETSYDVLKEALVLYGILQNYGLIKMHVVLN